MYMYLLLIHIACCAGGLMSVFLMGVYNPASKKWCTVTKVGNGFDDKTLDNLQKELKMVKISKDMSKVPSWLSIKKGVLPDFVIADPKTAPIWEISGAEFSKSDIHTADGISIRFPRVTKVRDDKTWETATDYPRLQVFQFIHSRVDIFVETLRMYAYEGYSIKYMGKKGTIRSKFLYYHDFYDLHSPKQV